MRLGCDIGASMLSGVTITLIKEGVQDFELTPHNLGCEPHMGPWSGCAYVFQV